MKKLEVAALFLIFLAVAALAQSAIPKAVKETINLAPRSTKGELQQYLLTYEITRLNADGSIKALKTDYLAYTQVCLANTPERGIEYQLTIDSFTIGTSRFPNDAEGVLQVAHQFDGFTVKWLLDRKLRSRDGCFDSQTPLPASLYYLQGWELLVHMAYINIWEQGRFTVGRQLSRIGDTASFSIPGPFCASVPQVVKTQKLHFGRQKFELTGISNYRNRPCAIIKVHQSSAPNIVDLASDPDSTFIARGTTSIVGEIWISLDKGQIVQAIWKTRTDATFDDPRFKSETSHTSDVYWLRQLN